MCWGQIAYQLRVCFGINDSVQMRLPVFRNLTVTKLPLPAIRQIVQARKDCHLQIPGHNFSRNVPCRSRNLGDERVLFNKGAFASFRKFDEVAVARDAE